MKAQTEKKGRDFEKLTARIHSILEPDGSVVKWNEHISDPDSGLPRQIDILITTPNGKSKYIECRDRSRAQHVTWIEELIGRKVSLNLEEIIAVSSSRFGKGAIAKAQRFDIQLYTLEEVTDEDIISWKPIPSCYLSICRVKNLQINVKPSSIIKANELKIDIINSYKSNKSLINNHLDSFFHSFYENNPNTKTEGFSHFKFFLRTTNILELNSIPIEAIHLSADLQLYEHVSRVITNQEYQSFDHNTKAHIDTFDSGTVVISTDEKSTVTINLANINLKRNNLWTGQILMGFGKLMTIGELHIDIESYNAPPIDMNFSII